MDRSERPQQGGKPDPSTTINPTNEVTTEAATTAPVENQKPPETSSAEPQVETEDEANDKLVIDEADINTLVNAGVPYNQAALALSQSGNKGVDAALDWIADQQNVQNERRLSPEEAERKALELQRQLREKRLAKEKQEERERERQRIESTKALLQTKRALEEQEKKRIFEQIKREKEEQRKAEAHQKELMALEYRERFGRDMPSEELDDESKKPPRERIKIYVGRFRDLLVAASSDEEKKRIITCLKTVRTYCNNAKSNPIESKYHQIRTQNAAFQERVAPYEDAIKLLNTGGFLPTDDNQFLKIRSVVPDGFILGECIKFIDFVLGQFT